MVLLIPDELEVDQLPNPIVHPAAKPVSRSPSPGPLSPQEIEETLKDDASTSSEEPLPYAIKEIATKGTGVVATRRIFPGEIIMREEPLFVVADKIFVDTEKTEKYLDKLINRLGSEKVIQFLSLTDCTNEEASYVGRFYTNCMDFRGDAAIFPTMARVNHSCRANSEFVSRVDLGHQRLVANYIIEEGEEITINYMSMAEEGTDNRMTRNRYLLTYYSFRCTCMECTLQDSELAENDVLREEMKELMSVGLENLEVDELKELTNIMFSICPKQSFSLEIQDVIFRKSTGVTEQFMAAVKGLEIAIQVFGEDSPQAEVWNERIFDGSIRVALGP